MVAGLLGCGGSINGSGTGTGGQGGATTTISWSAMGACECMAASDRCEGLAEACWCPSECDPNIACICGGGRFIECHNRPPANDCNTQATRVTSMCADRPFVDAIYSLCVSNPDCMGQCLSALTTAESCAQIDCSFCSAACDCMLPSTPSALRACVVSCWAAGNP